MLPQRGDPGFTFAGILALAALSAFMWKAGPLETARPVSTSAGWHEFRSDQQVPARLWQDPFKAVFGLGERADGKRVAVGQANLRKDIAERLNPKGSVLLLAVMASPGSYAEIEERRRRQRYAVVTALADSGYVPTDPQSLRVTTVVFSPPEPAAPIAMMSDGLSGSAQQLPYEWYQGRAPPPGAPEHVAVLWLDESWLAARPYYRIRQLLQNWLPEGFDTGEAPGNANDLSVVVLGPARSESLLDFWHHQSAANDHVDWLRNSCLKSFRILSSSATAVPQATLPRPWFGGNGAPRGAQAPATGCGPSFMEFTSTVHSDDVSIGELIREMRQRGIDPRKHHVAVISEWDTYYGRYLPTEFERQYCNDSARPCKVLRYTYQRGIDGIALTADATAAQADEDTASGAREPLPFSQVKVRRPVGRSQFDYLRRLAESVREHDRRLRLESGYGGIRAVAVLGSDVYDKLLILRALRPQLPGRVWLTTDLDAQMLHPAEFPWTRNMVVASSAGLQLHDALRTSSAPFRDNYQTSAYVAARLALDRDWLDHAGLPPVMHSLPMLYEVGRSRAVQLSAPAGAEAAETQQRQQAQAANISAERRAPLVADFTVVTASAALAVGVILVLAFQQSRPQATRRALGLAAVLVVMTALTALGIYSDRVAEPFSFSEGVSIWPTIYLRVAALIIAIALVFYAIQQLRANQATLNTRYFDSEGAAAEAQETDAGAWDEGNPKLTAAIGAVFVLMFFIVMGVVRGQELALAQKVGMGLALWGLLGVAWWSYIYRGHSPVRSVNEWITRTTPQTTVTQLWHQYQLHGDPLHRFMRTFAFMTLYLAFASTVFLILGAHEPPCRGFACIVNRIVLIGSVLSMLFLLFFVVDATRLCAAWIDLMARPGRAWGGGREEWFGKALDLPPAPATAWMQVRLIGERTTEVARLIYYPMLVILLLLIARSTYFDDWGFPKALAIVVGLNFLIALGCGVLLRRSACRGRENILDALRDRQMSLAVKEHRGRPPVDTAQRIRDQVQELEQLQIGAYRNLRDQPVFRAAILVGSGLGLVASEYLLTF